MQFLKKLVSDGYSKERFIAFLQARYGNLWRMFDAGIALSNDERARFPQVALRGVINFRESSVAVVEAKLTQGVVLNERSARKYQLDLAKKVIDKLIISRPSVANSFTNNALFVFVDNLGNFRISLITTTLERSDNRGNVRLKTNSFKRQSFLVLKGSTSATFLRRFAVSAAGTYEKKSKNSFEELKEIFSVESLTKEFYNSLFNWFEWAKSEEAGVTFPDLVVGNNTEKLENKLIRLITRLMFVWFIKQKGLVPAALFEEQSLRGMLRNFDPQATNDGCFYNAILQNLFFATLNRAIKDADGNVRTFTRPSQLRAIANTYRYADMFKFSKEEVIEQFSTVPFLNCALFECLDKKHCKAAGETAPSYEPDGFSDSNVDVAGKYKHRAFIPNHLFFTPWSEDKEIPSGLLAIFKQYDFTTDENGVLDADISLDPELLGHVFENLLASIDEDTKEQARKASGSFYTPRVIVNYMVDEVLIAHIASKTDDAPTIVARLRQLLNGDNVNFTASERERIRNILETMKILDPACGSGAFPMGCLSRMIEILEKIGLLEDQQSIYETKLKFIKNCIYGVDIQPIAAQISKLRFFISLMCEIKIDNNKENFGVPALPGLETKFVCANTLFEAKLRRLKRSRQNELNLVYDDKLDQLRDELLRVRNAIFVAKTASEKLNLRERDEELRSEIKVHLLGDNPDLEEAAAADELASWNPYDQNLQAIFFDAEWMFCLKDKFDVVIGNPPYIQLSKNQGKLGKLYESCNYETFARTGDIYSLFYERGWQLLKDCGKLCYITSNKWMRTQSGERTRNFLATRTNPLKLIDFAGVKIFESATVDTNILLFEKSENKKQTFACVTKKLDCLDNLSNYIQHEGVSCAFENADSWIVLTPIEQSIKRKIEAAGTPLRDWDINIYRGVLTGFNEAFIISGEKRQEILSNCKTEDERKRTDELIRPILRGRDIKRYSYEFADLWLINTHNGVKEKNIPRIDVEKDYPAIKQHLDQYWGKIEKRADKGDTPYNLRNCAYLEDFFKPKIMYSEIVREPQFYLDNKGAFFPEATSFIMSGNNLEYLYNLFHSKPITFFFKTFYAGGGLGENGYRYKKTFFELLPVPEWENTVLQNKIKNATDKTNICQLVYQLYGITKNEICFIESN